jgi:hypothetical protein
MDAKLAVIGLGSIGSMALWQASRLSDSVVGFEAATPAHGRSAVGGDTRLFRMIYLGRPEYYPIIERSRSLWAELETETGQDILTTTGSLTIGTANSNLITSLIDTARTNGAEHYVLSREEIAKRYPQHNLRPDDCAVYDPRGGVLRTDPRRSGRHGPGRADRLHARPGVGLPDHGDVGVPAGRRARQADAADRGHHRRPYRRRPGPGAGRRAAAGPGRAGGGAGRPDRGGGGQPARHGEADDRSGVRHMGLHGTRILATLFDGITRHSSEERGFQQFAATHGFHEAVRWRDSGRWITDGGGPVPTAQDLKE